MLPFVEDNALSIILATERPAEAGPVNLGGAEEVSINNLVSLICDAVKTPPRFEFDLSGLTNQP